MLISCCEIFALKPVSHSHTPAKKDTMRFFKRISFIYFFTSLFGSVTFFLLTVSNKKAAAKHLTLLMMRRRKVV